MNTPAPPVQLLKQKRTSARIDARQIEAQLRRLGNSTATAGVRANLRCIVRMFRDYIATLNEDIRNLRRKPPRTVRPS